MESLTGKLRDKLLDREVFDTLLEAKVLIERWRKAYGVRQFVPTGGTTLENKDEGIGERP